MIKIIKEGKLPKPQKTLFTVNCNKCNCEFEFEMEDFTKIERTVRSLDGCGRYFIKCPYCNYEIMGKYEYFNPRRVEIDTEENRSE